MDSSRSKAFRLAGGAALVLLVGAGWFIAGSGGEERTWLVPPLQPGDTWSVERTWADPARESRTSQVVFVGPIHVPDEWGRLARAYFTAPAGGASYDGIAYLLDVSAGRSLGLALATDSVLLVPLMDPAYLQGLELRRGLSWGMQGPDRGTFEFEVREVTRTHAVVIADSTWGYLAPYRDSRETPVWETGEPARQRYEFTFRSDAPIPDRLSRYDQAPEGGWSLAYEDRFTFTGSSPVHQRAVREPVDTLHDTRRELAGSVSSWPASSEPAAWGPPDFSYADAWRNSRSDSNLSVFLAAHPDAELVDIAYVYVREDRLTQIEGRPYIAAAWNLTWADSRAGAWYSYVEVRYFSGGSNGLVQEVEKTVGGLLGQERQFRHDWFMNWKRGGFDLEAPAFSRLASDLHAAPGVMSTVNGRLAWDVEPVVGARWTLIHTESSARLGGPGVDVLGGRPAYFAQFGAWAFEHGLLTFRFAEDDAGRLWPAMASASTGANWYDSSTGRGLRYELPGLQEQLREAHQRMLRF